MDEEKDAAVKYCRREIGDETPTKFCMRPVKHVNALDWCDECRDERLPFWPAGDAPKAVKGEEIGGGAARAAVLSEQAARAVEPLTPDKFEAAQ